MDKTSSSLHTTDLISDASSVISGALARLEVFMTEKNPRMLNEAMRMLNRCFDAKAESIQSVVKGLKADMWINVVWSLAYGSLGFTDLI